MLKTFRGSCHCGSVRFEAKIDLMGETSKCNCSICTKSRFWKTMVAQADFRLLEGSDNLTSYQFGGRIIDHLFCSKCGVKPFGRVEMKDPVGTFYAINVTCLDDAAVQELADAPVTYQDGHHDNYDQAPDVTGYL